MPLTMASLNTTYSASAAGPLKPSKVTFISVEPTSTPSTVDSSQGGPFQSSILPLMSTNVSNNILNVNRRHTYNHLYFPSCRLMSATTLSTSTDVIHTLRH